MEITATAVAIIVTTLLALIGFLATIYWNQKNFNNNRLTPLEDKVDKLQVQIAEHESRFDLVIQKIDTTELAIAKLESTVTAKIGKMEDKLDRIIDWMYKSNS